MAKNGKRSGYAHDLEALETGETFHGLNEDEDDTGLDHETDFDALNDETFGAATTGDWESAHEQLAHIEEGAGFFETVDNSSKSKANVLHCPTTDGRKFLAHQLEGDLMRDPSSHSGLRSNGMIEKNGGSVSMIPPELGETFFNLNLGSASTPTIGRVQPTQLNQTNISQNSHASNNNMNHLVKLNHIHDDKNLSHQHIAPDQSSRFYDLNWTMSQVEQSYLQNMNQIQTPADMRAAHGPMMTANHSPAVTDAAISNKSLRLEDIEASILSTINSSDHLSNSASVLPTMSSHYSSYDAATRMSKTAPVPPPGTVPKMFTLDELENFSGGDQPNRRGERLLPSGLNSPCAERLTPSNLLTHNQSPLPVQHLQQQMHLPQQYQPLQQPPYQRDGRNQYHPRTQTSHGPNEHRPSIRYCPNPLNPLEMIAVDESKQERYDAGGQYQRGYQNRNENGHYNNQRNFQRGGLGGNRSYAGGFNRGRSYGQGPMQQPINRDEYAGLMTRRDVDWVRKILRMPLEFDDPYTQDYYYVTYQTRKIAAQMLRRERESGQSTRNNTIPTLIVPDRAGSVSGKDQPKAGAYTPIDFAGSLGKLQVSNVNCPRKLLDFGNKLQRLEQQQESCHDPLSLTEARNEVNKFRQMLLEIERHYAYILEIDHEDKRMAALPEEARAPHIARRAELCDLVFKGILTTDDQKHLNFSIANIRKGCMLMFRAIQVFHDARVKAMCISELLNVNNFHYVVMQKDKTLYCLDYGQILVQSIATIRNCDFELLLQIADGLDDPSVIAKFQCGQEIIEMLLNQYQHFEHILESQKAKWISFVNRVYEDVEDISHLRDLCLNQLDKLSP